MIDICNSSDYHSATSKSGIEKPFLNKYDSPPLCWRRQDIFK